MPKFKTNVGKTAPEFAAISGNIAYLCRINHLSQTALAERIHCDRRTLYAKMEAPEKFAVRDLARIAKVFGVTLPELVEGRGKR